jgi:hypothetical protein
MLGLHLVNLHPDPDYAVIVKIKGEPCCLGCGVRRHPQRVILEGWLAGKTTRPDGVVPLCVHCLDEHSRGELDIWPRLRPAEIRFAMRELGGYEAARRVLFPSEYSRTMEKVRRDAA